MSNPLLRWMRRASPSDRQQVTILVLSMALYLFHITWFSTWQIEDAAISYAYARNFALGDGFVTNVGGEWVEGFSNPTWTLLLSAGIWLGLDPFPLSKLLGAAFGLATLPLAWLWARRLQPHDDSIWPALAPFALAMSTQFSLWTVAGLENSLFGFLLTAGVVLILKEGDTPSWGWSGIFLGLLAFSRPEAPLYAGVIAGFGGIFAVRAGGVRWACSFLVLSAGPFFSWHLWRYQAFAWEFPNTYYAKLGEKKFFPWKWGQRCWGYLRGWALNSAHVFLMPVFALGQSGRRKWPAGIALITVGVLALLLLPGLSFYREFIDADFPKEPVWVMYFRVPWLVLTPMVLLGTSLFNQHRRPRLIASFLVLAVFFFAVFSGGDWMRGYRWMSLCVVPLSVLLADGARTVSSIVAPWIRPSWLQRIGTERLPWIVAAPVLLTNIGQTIDVLQNIDTSPFDVRRRVLFTQGVQRRLHLDHASNLEVDMGANVYWSGFQMYDLAGLCTVPIARHHYPLWFVDTYFRDEAHPTFAHLHGGWANKTKAYKRPWFRRDYVQIPGFGHSFFRHMHQGNYIRTDLFIEPVWKHGPRQMPFGRRFRLDDLRTPAPEVHPGGVLYVETGWSVRRSPVPFRSVLFLHRNGRVITRALPPAYDWLPTEKWRTQKTYIGRYTLPLPNDMEPGRWDLGIVVFGEGLRAKVQAAENGPTDPVYLPGEMRWDGVIEVLDVEQVKEIATVELGHAVIAARAGDCNQADEHWSTARRHLAPDHPWQHTARLAADYERAACWAERALINDDVEQIARARRLDHTHPRVRAISIELADRWEQRGDRAEEAMDQETQWTGWANALRADPTRSWLRRKTEMLRKDRWGAKKKK